jgi:hypothetical protein
MPPTRTSNCRQVADRQGCPMLRAGQRPSRKRLATRTSSRPLSLPSPAGYPPAHISQIRTTTNGAAVPKSSTHNGGYRVSCDR